MYNSNYMSDIFNITFNLLIRKSGSELMMPFSRRTSIEIFCHTFPTPIYPIFLQNSLGLSSKLTISSWILYQWRRSALWQALSKSLLACINSLCNLFLQPLALIRRLSVFQTLFNITFESSIVAILIVSSKFELGLMWNKQDWRKVIVRIFTRFYQVIAFLISV